MGNTYSDKLKPGLIYVIDHTVSEKDTALYFGSGGLDVLATPALLAYMEQASFLAIEKYLPAEYSTVGISIHMEHIGAAIKGEQFECKAELIEIDDKKFILSIVANNKKRKLATAKHIRYLIHKQDFMNRLNDR
ncbi:MAG: hotdog domain-containing protein [Bacteroidales bacterium]|nr:hotdog domain-containing protein [Bacteroidales bacterium]